jgi:gas vesicle protein
MEVLIGLGAGAVVAAVCALFYRMGVKDGMKFKKTARAVPDEGGEDVQNELMRKYELIMGYDPYGEKI